MDMFSPTGIYAMLILAMTFGPLILMLVLITKFFTAVRLLKSIDGRLELIAMRMEPEPEQIEPPTSLMAVR